PEGTDLTALIPSLTFENCLATTGTVYDFSTPVVYEYIGPGGCPSEWVVVADIETGYNNKDFKGISVFPNPAKQQVIIRNANGFDILLYNSLGIPVLQQKISDNLISIDLSDVADGLYIMHFSLDDKRSHKRILVHK
ncbi:MAG: T9SS type A sorting domain-containing protein, partial [Bacteroidales bacterium]|nr:T9SS type A sorting domain-containing protein [Bacteroidales bacterium]